jgi:hypothetical protein
MSMNEFRRLAAKIDQHMQQLAAQGVSEAHAIINRPITSALDHINKNKNGHFSFRLRSLQIGIPS